MATKATKKNKFVKAWIAEHVNDPWVKEATRLGYRSRAAFKLIELAEKDKLLRPGHARRRAGCGARELDQVLRERAGPKTVIVAIDLLPVEPLAGVTHSRAGRLSGGRRPRNARKCAWRAQAGPCGFGLVPQSVGRGSGRPGAIGASWRPRARICGGFWLSSLEAISSSKRFRAKVSLICGAPWRNGSIRSTCGSRRRRGTAVARSTSLQRASNADVWPVGCSLSPKRDMRLA